MIIQGRRIRNLDRHLDLIDSGTEIAIGLPDLGRFAETLERAGLNDDLREGDAILPSRVFGPVSEYNAEGKYLALTDRPMETAHRMAEWHWVEWHGRRRVEQSSIVDIPYKRYPRRFLPPPSVEFRVGTDTSGEQILYSAPIAYLDENKELLLHTINLYLEMFGECCLYTDQLETIIKSPLRRLNWTILPAGKLPWKQLRQHLEPLIEKASEGNQPLIRYRLEKVNAYGPEFTAVGRGGFEGYVIFGFPDRPLYVCESRHTGNATYVFGQDWEALSRMTKAEILSESLQEARLIHREGWERQLRNLMQS